MACDPNVAPAELWWGITVRPGWHLTLLHWLAGKPRNLLWREQSTRNFGCLLLKDKFLSFQINKYFLSSIVISWWLLLHFHTDILSCSMSAWGPRLERAVLRFACNVFSFHAPIFPVVSPPPPRARLRLPPTQSPGRAHYEVMDTNSPVSARLRIITRGMSIEASNWSWLVLIWQRPQFFTD